MRASEVVEWLEIMIERYGDCQVLVDGWDIDYIEQRGRQIFIELDVEEW